MTDNALSPDETQVLIDYARQRVAEERYPLSPVLRPVREALAKLDASRETVPLSKRYPIPASVMRKKRR